MRPRWVQHLRLFGIAVVAACLAVAVMDTVEWHRDVAGSAILVGVAAAGLLAIDWLAQRWPVARLAAAAQAETDAAARRAAFIAALEVDAADSYVHAIPFGGEDVLRMMREHGLLDQVRADRLIQEARQRAIEETGLDPMAPQYANGSGGFDRIADDEIPF